MARAEQISVSLPNKRGQLAQLCRALADKKINILAISVAETSELGTVRLVVSKPAAAAKMLKECGLTCAETDVLLVELPNTIGALARATEKLRARRVNVDYVYGSTGKRGTKATMVIGTSNLKAAQKALGGK